LNLYFVLDKKHAVQEFSWLYINNRACCLSCVLILFSCMMHMCYSFFCKIWLFCDT